MSRQANAVEAQPSFDYAAKERRLRSGRTTKGSRLHPNELVIEKFYESFHARDAAGMNVCYDPRIVFRDPAFGELEGEKVFAMWQMLCSRAKELQVSARNIQADDASGSAEWEASYLFGPDRRPVHNVIKAAFVFQDGKIVKHTDSFDMWKWTRMAVGGI